jgi:phosphate transport system protein
MMTNNRKHFIDELNSLYNKVHNMGLEVLDGYYKILQACELKSNEIAETIIDNDKMINDIEISINVDAYLLIAKQCPVAGDLRRIITALKVATDLERIGDYAVNMAKYLLNTKNDNQEHLDTIIALSRHLVKMLEGIMEAFIKEDIKLALEVNEMDEVLDEEYKNRVKKLIKVGKEKTDAEAEEAMRAILVVKQIERAGDHITNIAESIVYLVNGKRVELN